MSDDPRDAILSTAAKLIKNLGLRWWLEAGTALGAYRSGSFIPWDPDIDIGIAPGQAQAAPEIKRALDRAGFRLHFDGRRDGRLLELSFERFEGKTRFKLDLFFFEKGPGRVLWHGAWAPDDLTGKREFLPHVFPARLFNLLRPLLFRGVICFLPDPIEDYLEARYGSGWRVPDRNYRYWKDCKAVDRTFVCRL
jgi:hypothetical protein